MNHRDVLLLRICLVGGAAGCASLASNVARDGFSAPGQTASRRVAVGDGLRDYLLRVPTERARTFLGWQRPYPLVIVLHGSRARGESIREQSGMDSLAEARHFLVAYPDGTGGRFGLNTDWNAGECCGNAQRDGVDDVGFLRALIADVSARWPVDRRRVYVAGFSDGARMAYRAACEMAGEVAAVAAVSGSLVAAHCAPRWPIPVIAFHGTSDEEVPFADTAYTAAREPVHGASGLPPTTQFWMATNHCRGIVVHHVAPRVVETEGTGCVTDVVLYAIEGGPHGWPVAPSARDAAGTGYVISASPIIAQFFLRHRTP